MGMMVALFILGHGPMMVLAQQAGSAAATVNFPNLKSIVEKSAEGDARAQFKLGDYHYARGEFRDAVQWYEKSARQGYALAQTALANCYTSGRGVKRNSAEATKWLRMASHQKQFIPLSNPKTLQAKSGVHPHQDTTAIVVVPEIVPTSTETPLLVSPSPNRLPGGDTVVERVWVLQAPEPRIQDYQLIVRSTRY